MDANLEWRYEKLDGRVALVADNLPNYRAEIKAVFPTQGLKMRVWTVYEQQQVIAQGATTCTSLAKQVCAIYVHVAQENPLFDHLPPLNGTAVSYTVPSQV